MHSEPNNLMPEHLQSESTELQPETSQIDADSAPQEVLTDAQIHSRKTLRQILQNVGALGISTLYTR